MFKAKSIKNNLLVFVQSDYVKVFPCGRRRGKIGENQYHPFDPEARLNTEYNNRRNSSLNGFTNSAILDAFSNGALKLSIAGYVFDILPKEAELTSEGLGSSIISTIISEDGNTKDATEIYANIRLANTKIYNSEDISTTTKVLRNQTATGAPELSLDLQLDTNTDNTKASNFYFSGLSFSTEPIDVDTSLGEEKQEVYSLKILEKKDSNWVVCQTSLLPKIEHGEREDSVKIAALNVDELELNRISVPSMQIKSTDDNEFQLVFNNVDNL